MDTEKSNNTDIRLLPTKTTVFAIRNREVQKQLRENIGKFMSQQVFLGKYVPKS